MIYSICKHSVDATAYPNAQRWIRQISHGLQINLKPLELCLNIFSGILYGSHIRTMAWGISQVKKNKRKKTKEYVLEKFYPIIIIYLTSINGSSSFT